MRSINSPNPKADWENDLLEDLSFIKKKKRYRLGKKTLQPATITIIIIIVAARLSIVLFFTRSGNSAPPIWVEWLIGAFIAFTIISIIYRYYQTLVFKVIETNFHVAEHITLLQNFFRENNLAYTHHDKAPEVFMIISRNLDANPNNEYREVMVFIADDKRVLVNSHFTGSKFSITPPSGNYKKMAKKLQNWLNTQNGSSNIQSVAVQ